MKTAPGPGVVPAHTGSGPVSQTAATAPVAAPAPAARAAAATPATPPAGDGPAGAQAPAHQHDAAQREAVGSRAGLVAGRGDAGGTRRRCSAAAPAVARAAGPAATAPAAAAAARPAAAAPAPRNASLAESLRTDKLDVIIPDDAWSSESDIAAARSLFDELAVDHVAQVRDVMLELQQGDVACSWVESSKPALKSLRSMAQQLEQPDLCAALDEFCAAVDAAIASGKTQVDDASKAELNRRYQRLIEMIPKAFQLDAERDRREPIIVECLLRQVPGVERVTLDRLAAAGLGRLAPLLAANAGDMAATAGIRLELAEAIVARIRAYRAASASTVAAADAAAEVKELRTLISALGTQHDEFMKAATGWSDEALEKKKSQRKERDQTFLQIKLTLARLGAKDRLAKLEKMPFQDRIADLQRYLSEVSRKPSRGG